jgi:hypothetical protein
MFGQCLWGQCGCCFLSGHYRDDLECNQVTPLRNPLLQKGDVVAFHELKAAIQAGLDPTSDIGQTIRCKTPLLSEATIHCARILIPEAFYDHEEHAMPPLRITAKALTLVMD